MTRRWVLLLIIIIVGFLLYAPNLNSVLFWDDAEWIVNNPSVHNLSWENIKFIFSHDALAGVGLVSNYYRPILFLSFLGNYLIGGTSPIGYHLVNNIIHIANAILIYFLLEHFLKKRSVALIASLLFLIHPLQTEAVAYVSGRGDPLSVLFMLLVLVFFLHIPLNPPYIKGEARGILKTCLALLFAILALLSRETAVLFPVYLTVFLMAFVHKDDFLKSLLKSVKDSLPFYFISAFYGILRLTVLNFQNTLNFFHQANAYTENLSYRIYAFFEVILTYMRLIGMPIGLHMERDLTVKTSLFSWPVWFALILIILIMVIMVYFWKKGNRIWFFSCAMFIFPLIPTSGIFPINALLYEHWLYFSLMGAFTLFSWYFVRLWELLQKLGLLKIRILLVLFLIGYFVFFGVQTVRRNVIWGKPEDLYLDILKYEPKSVRAMTNLAGFYSESGKPELSRAYYQSAVDVGDIQPQAYYNMANILVREGDDKGAAALFLRAIDVDPTFPYAYLNLSALYARHGRLDESLKNLIILSSLRENDPTVWYNLALVADAMGDPTFALESIDKAESLAIKHRPSILVEIRSLKQKLVDEPNKK